MTTLKAETLRALAEKATPGDLYLITKGGAYYRPKAEGYTRNRDEAGRFTLAEAEAHSHPNGPDGPRDGIAYEPAPPAPTTNPETAGVEPVARYNNPKVGALANVLFDAFKRAEPDEGISKFPASYMATFADMAHAALTAHPDPASNTTSEGEGADKLRVVVHTGDGKTIDRKDDWTMFAGDVPIMDEDGFRSLDGPLLVARAILAMTAAIRSGSE